MRALQGRAFRLRLAAMLAFEVVQLFVDAIFDVLRRSRYLFACVVSGILSAFFVVFGSNIGTGAGVVTGDCSGVFRIAPRFLSGAFHLVRYTGVGELLIAYCFAYTLRDFACYLVELTFYLFRVHGLLLTSVLRGRAGC